MTITISGPVPGELHATPPRLSGVCEEPGLVLGLLRMFEACRVDGRLHLATEFWSGDVYLARGRIVAATCGPLHGTAALTALVESTVPIHVTWHEWRLLEGVAATWQDADLLSRFEPPSGPRSLDDADVQELITPLVDEVFRRVRRPIDDLEITALLESLGITDAVAAERYAAADVFALAQAVRRQALARATDGA